MKHIETLKGLKTLKERYVNSGLNLDCYGIKNYWLKVIDGCIKDNLAMDEIDYENTSQELRQLWQGLK